MKKIGMRQANPVKPTGLANLIQTGPVLNSFLINVATGSAFDMSKIVHTCFYLALPKRKDTLTLIQTLK